MQQFPTKALKINPTPEGGSGRRPHPDMPTTEKQKRVYTPLPDPQAVRSALVGKMDPNDTTANINEWSFQGNTSSAELVSSGIMNTPMDRKDEKPEGTQSSDAGKSSAMTLKSMPEEGLSDAYKSSDYYSVDLPSGFRFYPFKSLSVGLIRGRQQAKFSRAAREKSVTPVIEAVNSLLGDGVNVLDLTTCDFYWLMYWLLFASYPKRVRTATVICDNQAHIDAVEMSEIADAAEEAEAALPPDLKPKIPTPRTAKKVHADTLKNSVEYDKPILKELHIDDKALAELDLSPLNGVEVDVYRVRDMLQWETNFEEQATDEDYFVYDLAVYLKNGTLEERADIVRDMGTVAIKTLTRYRELVSNHGVEASLKSVCKECGAETEVTLEISARDFL